MMVAAEKRRVPELRFPGFVGEWLTNRVDYFVERSVDPVDVVGHELYRQIGVRSHGKGIFHKEPVTGASLGAKRVFWVHVNAFVVNIVFGWEQAVAVTSDADKDLIASHRFPMFVPKDGKTDLHFLLTFFLRKKGKHLLDLASPGGAGRNKTLGQNEFAKLPVTLPLLEEQKKIATFLGAVDSKLTTLRRKRELLQSYKRGIMQKIFSRELRFKREDGSDFPDWEEKRLGELCSHFKSGENITSQNISEKGEYPVYGGNGLRGYSDSFTHDGEFLLIGRQGALCGNIRYVIGRAYISEHAIVVEANKENKLGWLFQKLDFLKLNRLSESSAQPGLSVNKLQRIKLLAPERKEQQKIADFLTAIDTKIETVAKQINRVETFKKGLLQKMFV